MAYILHIFSWQSLESVTWQIAQLRVRRSQLARLTLDIRPLGQLLAHGSSYLGNKQMTSLAM